MRETLPDGILALADEVILDRRDAGNACVSDCVRVRSIHWNVSRRRSQISSAPKTSSRCANLRCAKHCVHAAANALRRPSSAFCSAVGSARNRLTDDRTSQPRRCAPRGRVCRRARRDRRHARIDPTIVDTLRAEARKTNAEWMDEIAEDVPRRLIEIARSRPETTIALAGTRRAAAMAQRPSFPRSCSMPARASCCVLAPPAGAETAALPEE